MLTSITPIIFPYLSPPPFPPCVSSGVLCICFVSQESCAQKSVCAQALRPAIKEISTLKRVLGPANVSWPPLQKLFGYSRTVARGQTRHPRARLTDETSIRYFGKKKLEYLHSVCLQDNGDRFWLPKEIQKKNRIQEQRAAKAATSANVQTPAPKRKIAAAVSQIAQKRLAAGITNASAAQPPETPCQPADFTAWSDDSSDDETALEM